MGSTDLEFIDSGMGVAHGRFYPEGPYQDIRAEVIRAAEARHTGTGQAIPPKLELTSETGEIVATGFVAIEDFDDIAVDPEISVMIEDREQYLRLAMA